MCVNSYSSSGSNNHSTFFLQRECAVLHPWEKQFPQGMSRWHRPLPRSRGSRGRRDRQGGSWGGSSEEVSPAGGWHDRRLKSVPHQNGTQRALFELLSAWEGILPSPSTPGPGTWKWVCPCRCVQKGRWGLGVQRPGPCFMWCHLISVAWSKAPCLCHLLA